MGDDRRGGAGGQGSRARTEDVVAAMEEGAEGGIIGDLLFTTRTELCKNHRDGNLT